MSILQINANLAPASSFSCSNDYLNHLYEVTKRTAERYEFDFPSDPNREKQGWTQDAQNMFNTAAYFYDARTFYKNWWLDMANNQDEQGYLGSVVPVVRRQIYDWNSPWWSGAIVFLPWEYYTFYGDRVFLKEAYQPMKKYVDFLTKMAAFGEGKIWNAYPYFDENLDDVASKEKILIWNGAGDWQNPYTKGQFSVPAGISTMTAYFHYVTIVAKTAALVGEDKDFVRYTKLANEIKQRFNIKYLDEASGQYGNDKNNQTAQVLPLALGLVDPKIKNLVQQQLLNAVYSKNDHIGTGFVATSFLLQTLTRFDESALANKIINQKDFPSWNTLIRNGVLTEGWDGKGAQMPSAGGQIGAWFFESVLGIRRDQKIVGFKHFVLAPQPDLATNLTWAKGYYDSPYGKIKSTWSYQNRTFNYQISIPANTTATVYIPVNGLKNLTESNLPIMKAIGVKVVSSDHNRIMLLVQSGDYQFTAKDVNL